MGHQKFYHNLNFQICLFRRVCVVGRKEDDELRLIRDRQIWGVFYYIADLEIQSFLPNTLLHLAHGELPAAGKRRNKYCSPIYLEWRMQQ